MEPWSAKEGELLRSLDAAVFAPECAAALRTICDRALAILERPPREIEAWEAVPLELYGRDFPA